MCFVVPWDHHDDPTWGYQLLETTQKNIKKTCEDGGYLGTIQRFDFWDFRFCGDVFLFTFEIYWQGVITLWVALFSLADAMVFWSTAMLFSKNLWSWSDSMVLGNVLFPFKSNFQGHSWNVFPYSTLCGDLGELGSLGFVAVQNMSCHCCQVGVWSEDSL